MPHVDSHPPGEFCWYDLFSKDLAASKTFYAGLFGWTADDQPTEGEGSEPYTMFVQSGDTVAGGGQMNREMLEGGTPPSWNAYVSVERLEPVLERVTAAGGTVIFPPVDVFDVGRLAYFANPEGAILALWQPKSNVGATRVDEPGTVCWVELATRDLARATAFYREVFGWHDVENPHGPPSGYRTMTLGAKNVGGILQMTEEWGEMPAHWSVYFEVDDAAASAERVKQLGGEVKFGPFETPVGQIAVCTDDGGAHFYLMQLSDATKAER